MSSPSAEFEFECEECKQRKTFEDLYPDHVPDCTNRQCKRYGEPMRELV